MLIVETKMSGQLLRKLAEIYRESLARQGGECYPDETEFRQIALAEAQLGSFLREDFFQKDGICCCLWLECGKPVSALRLWRDSDGVLLEGLETAPEYRGHGFASRLIAAVQEKCPSDVPIFSHVNRKNTVSLSIHRKLGFRTVRQSARCRNGEVSCCYITLRWERSAVPASNDSCQ